MRALAALALAGALVLVLGGAPHAAAGEWLPGDLHIHTTYSHDSYGGPADDNTGPDEGYTLGHTVASQFAVAQSRGLRYLAITDHDDIRSQSDPGFGTGGLIAIPGYEGSLKGHAQVLGARRLYPKGDSSAAAVNSLAAALRADGGVFQINHPAEGTTGGPDDLDWKYGYDVRPDTVEVLNISRLYQPPFPSGSSTDDAVRYWEGRLDRGERVAANGGSDNHYVPTTPIQGAGQPTTWVYAQEASVRGVLEGLRAGRTYISHQPPALGGPAIYLEADPGRDGTYEAMVGDTVVPGAPLRVRVTGAPGTLLRVISNGGRPAFAPVPNLGGQLEHRFTLPPQATWARAEVFHPDGAAERRAACDAVFGSQTTYCRNELLVTAITSAIYLRRPPEPEPPARLPGLARLSAPSGCVGRSFTATVTGRSVAGVSFAVDGRPAASPRRAGPRGRWSARIDATRLRPGSRHRLSARVRFAPSSRTAPRTLAVSFRRCGRAAGRPRFTG